MKKKKSEVENTLGNKTRLDTAAEKINEHEDIAIQTNQNENKKG